MLGRVWGCVTAAHLSSQDNSEGSHMRLVKLFLAVHEG